MASRGKSSPLPGGIGKVTVKVRELSPGAENVLEEIGEGSSQGNSGDDRQGEIQPPDG